MNRSTSVLATGLFALTVALTGGCEKKEEAAPAPKPAADAHRHDHGSGAKHDHDHDHAHDDHGHGEEQELGSVTIGGFTVKVVQQGKVEAGKEAAFEFDVSGGEGKPAAVRAWIGAQDGAGSVKAKADLEEHGFHGHVEAPAPLPADAKLWIEIEDSKGVKSTGSIALK